MTTQNQQQETSNTSLRIGQLAQATGVSAKTIRYYEEVGVLPPAQRAENGYRLYSAEDVQRLRFIRNARRLDFSLDDLREVVALRDRGEAPCNYVAHLLQQKATEIEEQIQQLQALQQDLQQLVVQVDNLPAGDLEAKTCACHLIYHPSDC